MTASVDTWIRERSTTALAWPLFGLLAVALMVVQSQHGYLIAPYENDFPGFAARAASLRTAFRLDGFYPLGYPALLWLVGQFTGEVFTAAQVVAVGASLALVACAWGLGRTLDPQGSPFLLPLLLVANPYFWESALFLGTDMPWASLQCLAILGLVRAVKRDDWQGLVWPGIALGLAYLVRYTALIMLPVVWAYLILCHPLTSDRGQNTKGALAFTLAFLLAAAPQLVISVLERGTPFFTLQAKNVWFGVYGGGDWRANWTDVRSDVGLLEVIRLNPLLLLRHWGIQFGTWWIYSGVLLVNLSRIALEKAGQFTRWLLVFLAALPSGLVVWLVAKARRRIGNIRIGSIVWFLLGYYLIYGLSISLVFVQPRFYLALLPIVLLAGVVSVRWLWQWVPRWLPRWTLAGSIFFAGMLNSTITLAQSLGPMQPPVAQVVQALEASGADGEDVIVASLSMPYAFHTAYHFEALPADSFSWQDLREKLQQVPNARFLLFEKDYGLRYWPNLADLLNDNDLPAYLHPVWHSRGSSTMLYRLELTN